MLQPLVARRGALLGVYLKPQRAAVALLTVLLFASIGLQLAGPQVLRIFIDAASGAVAGASANLRHIAILFVVVAFLQQFVAVLATWLSENIGWTATNALRADLAHHCLHLDLSFHKGRTPGELIERIDGDVTALANFFSQFVIQVVGNLLLTIGILVVLWRVDLRTGVALTVFALAILVTMTRLRAIVVPSWAAARQASAELFGFIEERLAGVEDIRASGAKAYVISRLHELLRQRLQRERSARLKGFLVWSAPSGLFAVGNGVAFAIVAYRHHAGTMSLGTAFVVYYYTRLLIQPLIQISNQIQEFQKATAGIGRIRELFAIQSALTDIADAAILPLGPLSIEFERVSFGYNAEALGQVNDRMDRSDSDGMIIRDISFRLEPGEVIGLLGHTGSGKTTIARLLFRLYDPTVGVIRLGGVDLHTLRRSDLHRRVGLVTQDVQLFRATIRDNLAFFDQTIPDERIWTALTELGLASWIRALPAGLDTVLTAGGDGLSAGEAQLLAFGRVFLRDPSLIILDEASSRLDLATETLIEHAIDRLLRGRTAIVIAHRLSTISRADTIMIMEGGRVRECGARDHLASDPGSHFQALLHTGVEGVLA